jgi:hypothetical protein
MDKFIFVNFNNGHQTTYSLIETDFPSVGEVHVKLWGGNLAARLGFNEPALQEAIVRLNYSYNSKFLGESIPEGLVNLRMVNGISGNY